MMEIRQSDAVGRQKLQNALGEAQTIKMLIWGDGEEVEKIVEHAKIIAGNDESVRRLIWAVNSEIFTSAEKELYKVQQQVGCVLDRIGRPVVYLNQENAARNSVLEKAFAIAYDQTL